MATSRKGKVNNSSFLKMMETDMAPSIKKVGELQNRENVQIESDYKNELQHIDIFLMDDAPEDWNQYPRLKENQVETYLELKISIFNKGVLEPILLLEQSNGRFMVLAGHNRRDISKEIVEENKSMPGFDENKFRYPPCIVRAADELTNQELQDIINDTNCQRDFGKLPLVTQVLLTKRRMEYYQNNRYSKGERIDQLARELGLKKTSIYENLTLVEKVIPEFQRMYYDQKLMRKTVLKFAHFDKMTQEWIRDEFQDKIVEGKVKGLKKNMDRDDIKALFNGEDISIKKITIEIPANREDEFRELLNQFLKAKE